MRLHILASLSVLLLLPASACADAPAAERAAPDRLRWEIEPQDQAGKVQLELSHRSPGHSYSTSRPIDLSALRGLDPARLSGASSADVRFRLVREAGTFDCEGKASRGRGVGDCRFLPDAAFSAGLRSRAIGEASGYQLFQLAMADMGLVYADELKRLDYARPTIDDLVDAGNHGADLAFLRSMGGLGYRVGTVAALVRMRDHGVSPDFVRDLVEAGLRDLPAETLVEMRDHGVAPAFIGELRRLGYRDVPVRELIALRDHGVTADYVRGLAAHGIEKVPLARLIEMRDHGVTAEYAGALRRLGYVDLGTDDLVRLRDNGVSVEFVRSASEDGLRSADELIRLRNGG